MASDGKDQSMCNNKTDNKCDFVARGDTLTNVANPAFVIQPQINNNTYTGETNVPMTFSRIKLKHP